MELKFEKKKHSEENLIPLINIVFLILIFFLITTVIRPFSAKDIELAKAVENDKLNKVVHSLVIDKNGALTANGGTITLDVLPSVFQAEGEAVQTVNIIADKALAADKLLEIVSQLGDLKLKNIKLIIEISK
ncbi:MAG: biopolymer transporter ExbD [Rhizobiales bacterium]|nr:biopolymer transporter ExbD [Hyphomicrobiales bacterium]